MNKTLSEPLTDMADEIENKSLRELSTKLGV